MLWINNSLVGRSFGVGGPFRQERNLVAEISTHIIA